MKYISLGYFCSVATELEKLGLRSESSPFDWVISDFEGVIAAVQEHFSGFLDYEYLVQDKSRREIYKNAKYNIKFFHDFNKYSSLEKQLPAVREKYNKRISRFYRSITEPTLFIRYISDEKTFNGKATELVWIENNYEQILDILRSYNKENDILFIANEGVSSNVFPIYNVKKDKNDVVSRSPIHNNVELYNRFINIDYPGKQANISRYKVKQKNNRRIHNRIKRKMLTIIKHIVLKEYTHENQY